jgi:hypothetical protein
MAAIDFQVPLPTLAQLAVSGAPPLEPLTLDQVEQMVRYGILKDGAPIELIDGLLVYKDRSARGEDLMTHNPAHALCVKRLMGLLSFVQSLGFHLQCQLPIALLPTRAPEPDVSIIRGVPEVYRGRHPGPNDVAAVFEVADSSLEYDRTIKQRLYASAGISIYWIANLIDDLVEVYERPNVTTGKYDIHNDYKIGDVIELSLLPNAATPIRVDEIVG